MVTNPGLFAMLILTATVEPAEVVLLSTTICGASEGTGVETGSFCTYCAVTTRFAVTLVNALSQPVKV